jgi:hypothetical protein
MWRQGDVFIAPVRSIPKKAARQPGGVLVEGELTGHSHRLESLEDGELFQHNGTLFLRVVAESARIIHQEHGPITLKRGRYRIWGQREYSPGEIRWVVD